jgi:hypothetical protein
MKIDYAAVPLYDVPITFPDEMFWSVFWRYQLLSGQISAAAAYCTWFGTVHMPDVSTTIPIGLDRILERLGNISSNWADPEYVLNLTPIRFYTAFMPTSERAKCRHLAISDSRAAMWAYRRSVAGYPLVSFKWCGKCVDEDRRTFGVAYFHRIHSLAIVKVCPTHGTWLELGSVQGKSGTKPHKCLAPPVNLSTKSFCDAPPKRFGLHWFAKQCAILLSSELDIGQRTLNEIYRLRAIELGFSYQKNVKTDLVASQLMLELENNRFYENFSVNKKALTKHTLARTLHRHSPVSYVIPNLIMTGYLFGGIEELIFWAKARDGEASGVRSVSKEKTLGATDIFRSKVLESYVKNDYSTTKTKIDTHVGFANLIRWVNEAGLPLKLPRLGGPHLARIIATEAIQHLEAGMTWHEVCAYLEIGRAKEEQLKNIFPDVRQAIKIRLAQARKDRREQTKEKHRLKLITYLSKLKGNGTRTTFRKKHNAAATWLLENDLLWYEKTFPPPKKATFTRRARDEDLANQARKFARGIRNKTDKPEWVNQVTLLSKMGIAHAGSLSKNYPKLVATIKAESETKKAFSLRLAQWYTHLLGYPDGPLFVNWIAESLQVSRPEAILIKSLLLRTKVFGLNKV